MIVRRIREHLVAHSWFAVAVDFLIVVVGVLIGMQASNWNNRRIEHHQSLSYRSRLIDELDFNARQFAQQIAYYEQVRGHALATMRALESRSSESSDFFVHAYQSTQIDITPPKRFIYDEMVSSGLVERLGSERLQAQASDYYLNNKAVEETYGVVPPYRALMRTLIPHVAQAQIRGRCGDISVTHEGRNIASRLPERCGPVHITHRATAPTPGSGIFGGALLRDPILLGRQIADRFFVPLEVAHHWLTRFHGRPSLPGELKVTVCGEDIAFGIHHLDPHICAGRAACPRGRSYCFGRNPPTGTRR